MAPVTRRGFIKHASVGAATVGALSTLPTLATAHAARGIAASDRGHAGLHEPLAAVVRDVRTGEIALLIGTREVIVHDPDLAMRLVKAAR
ncbi:MAG TPA: twin-arginine translocation signal domain-containing protein [Chloroflexota bacterium]|nr:twin-arginine translocation signal domain-containing protein [Chloroflexota bacterium]